MAVLGNTPRRLSRLVLEARKSYAFGMKVLYFATKKPVDITGSVTRLVVAQPERKGGAVVIDVDAEILDAELGLLQFSLQATDLDLEAGEYPFSVTMVTQLGYSTVIMKGALNLQDNTESESTLSTYEGINPSTNLAAYLESGDLVTLLVDQVDGMSVIVTGLVSLAQTAAAEAEAAATAAEESAAYAQGVANGDLDVVLPPLIDDPLSQVHGSVKAIAEDAVAAGGGGAIDFDVEMTTVDADGLSDFRAQQDARLDGEYSPLGHDHDGSYSPLGHDHDGSYSALGHDHDGSYSALGHDHDGSYSALGHNHDGSYSALGHNHDDRYFTETEADARFAPIQAALPAPTATMSNGTASTGAETYDSVLGTYQFTAVAGQRYRICYDGAVANGSAANDRYSVTVRNGGASTPTTGSTLVAESSIVLTGTGSNGRASLYVGSSFVPGAGVVTLGTFWRRLAGTGNVTPVSGDVARELYVVRVP